MSTLYPKRYADAHKTCDAVLHQAPCDVVDHARASDVRTKQRNMKPSVTIDVRVFEGCIADNHGDADVERSMRTLFSTTPLNPP